MKHFITTLGFLCSFSTFADTDVLRDCYKEPNFGQFFVASLDTNAAEGYQNIMLLDKYNTTVGVIVVETANRSESYPYPPEKVKFIDLELCSSLETDSFSYTDNEAFYIKNWVAISEKNEEGVYISQDEGMILLKVELVSGLKYANYYKATFKAYDVFDFEQFTKEDESNPDWFEDWGLPKGKGEFYFYLPTSWK